MTCVVATASADEWVDIDPADLLVMDLAPDRDGRPRRVVIQLLPRPFSQGWVDNIRTLATAHWWDGTSVNRVQDNYVVQWGDASELKPLPTGIKPVPQSAYETEQLDIQSTRSGEPRSAEFDADIRDAMQDMLKRDRRHPQAPTPDMVSTRTKHAVDGWHQRDAYADYVQFDSGWPLGNQGEGADARFWPIHCYGMVGVGRNLPPDTGTGADLYVVIGQATRQLDRNIAVVGRIIAGIERLTSLPRGTGALGFYERAEERVPIRSVRLATELATAEQPQFQYLSTLSTSFRRYIDARANRRDPFYLRPAGGVDICNLPVPIRARKAG